MDFNEFVKHIEDNIKDYLPDDLKNATINIKETKKMDGSYTGMTVVREGERIQASAVVNLEAMFEVYSKNPDIDKMMPAISTILASPGAAFNLDIIDNYDMARSNLFIRVSSADKNRHKLADIPHKLVENLVITYHVKIDGEDGREGSVMLTNQLVENYGVSAEQLHKDACANSQSMFPVRTMPLWSAAGASAGRGKDDPIVLTNTAGVFGAAVLFYDGVLDSMADDFGGEILIIPSSVHEVLVFKCEHVSQYKDLEDIVKSVNSDVVDEQDQLAETVYYYSTSMKVLELASKHAETYGFDGADVLI